jgi:hypothetical protein
MSYITEKIAKIKIINYSVLAYRIHIIGDCSIIPIKIKRKQVKKRIQKKDVLVSGFTIKKCKEEKYYGFTLNGDHLYLIDSFIVNHNTHQSMNILKFMIEQGIKPYYVYSEAGSGWLRIANKLGIQEGSFYRSYHANPLAIEIEQNAFTIIDWLLVEDKSITDVVFKHINEEMERKGGILFVFSQLKENYEWFAPNMCKDFPSFAARYIFDDESGKIGHFQIDKMRSPKGDYRNYTINCTYDHVTKIFKAESLI